MRQRFDRTVEQAVPNTAGASVRPMRRRCPGKCRTAPSRSSSVVVVKTHLDRIGLRAGEPAGEHTACRVEEIFHIDPVQWVYAATVVQWPSKVNCPMQAATPETPAWQAWALWTTTGSTNSRPHPPSD